MRLLFLVAAFVSSSLLFVVEPLAAKLILPTFGGAPQVWNGAMLFFQIVLLLGYGYAHWSAKRVDPTKGRWLHEAVFLVSLLALPISVHTAWFEKVRTWTAAGGPPLPLVLIGLVGLVGLPFFALSANSSTLQRWYSLTSEPDAAQPWFLYSAGNVGSMLALLAYPSLIEPYLTLQEQGFWWSVGFVVLIALLAGCAFFSYKGSASARSQNLTQRRKSRKEGEQVVPNKTSDTEERPPIPETEAGIPAVDETDDAGPQTVTIKTKLTWLALTAVPSSLLLGVTTYITSNVAPIPLLWVVPLALYLLTFILVFARRPIAPAALLGRIYPLVLTPLVLVIVLENTQPAAGLVHLVVFFVACWMCHSRLALLKPSAARLTEFFFFVSLGGVVGGVFNTIVAPAIFNTLAEYPAALVAAALLIPTRSGYTGWKRLDLVYPAVIAAIMVALVLLARGRHMEAGSTRTFIVIGLPAILCFLAVDRPVRFGLSIGAGFLVAGWMHVASDGQVPLTARSFFGVHRVVLSDRGYIHKLFNGNTVHGIEDMRRPWMPLTYYYPDGPIGQVMQQINPRKAAFVGLGVGSLAAYGEPGKQFTYYEIDPVVKQIASDPNWFTFLHDTKADLKIVLGDARLELAKSSETYDLIVLDAFSSDAIPVHLLTKEAIEMYLRHLNPEGVLAFHISNRYLELLPVLEAAARDMRLHGYSQEDSPTPDEVARGEQANEWALLVPDRGAVSALKLSYWSEFDESPLRAWTDDYSNVLSVFKLNR